MAFDDHRVSRRGLLRTYAATLDEVSIRLRDGELRFDLDHRGDDVADRLTRLWRGSEMGPFSGFTTVGLVTLVAAGATSAVGLYIGYQAYRGLRRHDSAPIRYLSVGVFLLFGVAYVVAFSGTALLRIGRLPRLYQDYVRLVVRLLQLSGLLCIADSLHLMRSEPRATE
jgi:hypothetical protein